MYWHIDTDIISLIALCVIYAYNLKQPVQSGYALRDKRFARCLQAGVMITVIDIAASIIMEVPVSRAVYHIFMTAYFVAVQAVIVEWFMYAATILYQNDLKGCRTVTRVVLGVYIVYAVFNILNPWTGAVYSLSSEGVYTRGPFFMLMVALYAAYVVALFALVIIRWKKIPAGYPGFVLLLAPTILAGGIAAQLLNPGWLMILPAYMLCMLLTNQFLQSIRLRDNRLLVQKLSKAAATDPLTGIYNRAGAEDWVRVTAPEEDGKGCIVAMIDIDDLKVINDTMGHAQGDRAIKSVADGLVAFFAGRGMVSRYGGDEYLVCLTGEINETQAHMFLRGLLNHITDIKIGEADDVPLKCSVGASIGVVGRDAFADLCVQADRALYHVKRGGKNSYALYRREMARPDERDEFVS